MFRANQAIQRITGASPAFMRPPFGSYNNLVLQAAAVYKQSVVIWDFDSGDSTGRSVAQQKTNYTALAHKHPTNILALNHETYASTAHIVLPHAIKELRAKGYKLVTVAQCLGKAPYQSTGSLAPRTAVWHC